MGPLRRDSGLPWIVPPVPWYCGIGRTVGYGALKEGQWTPMDSPTCPMVLWDRTDSGIWGPQMGQWTPMDSPTCPMVQWDRTDSGIWWPSGGTVDSHGQSHLSHGTMG